MSAKIVAEIWDGCLYAATTAEGLFGFSPEVQKYNHSYPYEPTYVSMGRLDRISHIEALFTFQGCLYAVFQMAAERFRQNDYCAIFKCSRHAPSKWRMLEDGVLRCRQRDFASAVSNGKLWLIGGCEGKEADPMTTVKMYDLVAEQWCDDSSSPQLPVAIRGGQAIVHKEQLHLFGGWYGAGSHNAANHTVYTLPACPSADDNWLDTAVPPTPNGSPGVCSMYGGLLVAGGEQSGRPSRQAYFLDAEAGVWIRLPDFYLGGISPVLLIFDNALLIIGGLDDDNCWCTSVRKVHY